MKRRSGRSLNIRNRQLPGRLNPDHIESLLQHIRSLHPVSVTAASELEACLERVAFAKNDFLVREGKICRSLYFIEHGAVRGYFHLDGKEVTHWFAFENDFVTSLHSFIKSQPAVENIQLIEDATVWMMSKENLDRLMNNHHEIEKLVRIIYEGYYLRLEERFINAHFKTASERYQELLEESPHILERVPLGWIASYLGISQETLSRVRSKLG